MVAKQPEGVVAAVLGDKMRRVWRRGPTRSAARIYPPLKGERKSARKPRSQLFDAAHHGLQIL
jgi:hypothetical protein